MKRALVIASQTRGLLGVEHDAEQMARYFIERGFVLRHLSTREATRAGILAGYQWLVSESQPGDAAAVYYSGHGVRHRERDGRIWQTIVPADLFSSTVADWRGITAVELSLLQRRLTERTHNVTMIFDCCYAAQMSRTAAALEARPRSLASPVDLGFDAHLRSLRQRYGAELDALYATDNPYAVRLMASSIDEAAHELEDERGTVGGVMTRHLLQVLREVADAPVSWAAIAETVQARVTARLPQQRPVLEGPGGRVPFTCELAPRSDEVGVWQDHEGTWLRVGELQGVALRDVYELVELSGHRRDELEVVEVQLLRARVRRREGAARALPPGTLARLRERAARRLPVALIADAPALAQLTKATTATRTLRVALPEDTTPVATLRVVGDHLTIEDGRGPLFLPLGFPKGVEGALQVVSGLAVARQLRALEGAHGIEPAALEVELGVVREGEKVPLPARGASLGLLDQLYVELRSRCPHRLFVHVFNIDQRGAVVRLTTHAPTGVCLDPQRPTHVVGESVGRGLRGMALRWPEGLPRKTFARVDELLVIATLVPVDLRRLETPLDAVERAQRVADASAEPTRSKGASAAALGELLAQLQDGVTRAVVARTGDDDCLVQRLWFHLHPRRARLAGARHRDDFVLDAGSSARLAERLSEAWLEPGLDELSVEQRRGLTSAPAEVVVRLEEISLPPDARWGSGAVRVDALVCTRTASGAPATFTGLARVAEGGGAAALRDAVLYRGPASGFLEVALWASPEGQASATLGSLLVADDGESSAVYADAVSALADPPGQGDGPWVVAVGACAALTELVFERLAETSGSSCGLARVAFAGGEQLGVGRHALRACIDEGDHGMRREVAVTLVIERA